MYIYVIQVCTKYIIWLLLQMKTLNSRAVFVCIFLRAWSAH